MARVAFAWLSCALLVVYWKQGSASSDFGVCRQIPSCFRLTTAARCDSHHTREVCLLFDKDLDGCSESDPFSGSNKFPKGGICIAYDTMSFNADEDNREGDRHTPGILVTRPIHSRVPLCQKVKGPYAIFGIRVPYHEPSGAEDAHFLLSGIENVKCRGYEIVCDAGPTAQDIELTVPVESCPVPPNCNGCTYKDFESCSVSCGKGTKKRKMECSDPKCNLHGDIETTDCDGTSCAVPRHGDWCPWKPLGSCTKSCRFGGTQTETRTCECPSPLHGGNGCVGDNNQLTSCNDHIPCPKGGNLGGNKKNKAKQRAARRRRRIARRCKKKPHLSICTKGRKGKN